MGVINWWEWRGPLTLFVASVLLLLVSVVLLRRSSKNLRRFNELVAGWAAQRAQMAGPTGTMEEAQLADMGTVGGPVAVAGDALFARSVVVKVIRSETLAVVVLDFVGPRLLAPGVEERVIVNVPLPLMQQLAPTLLDAQAAVPGFCPSCGCPRDQEEPSACSHGFHAPVFGGPDETLDPSDHPPS